MATPGVYHRGFSRKHCAILRSCQSCPARVKYSCGGTTSSNCAWCFAGQKNPIQRPSRLNCNLRHQIKSASLPSVRRIPQHSRLPTPGREPGWKGHGAPRLISYLSSFGNCFAVLVVGGVMCLWDPTTGLRRCISAGASLQVSRDGRGWIFLAQRSHAQLLEFVPPAEYFPPCKGNSGPTAFRTCLRDQSPMIAFLPSPAHGRAAPVGPAGWREIHLLSP